MAVCLVRTVTYLLHGEAQMPAALQAGECVPETEPRKAVQLVMVNEKL